MFNNIARGREREGLVVFQRLLSMIILDKMLEHGSQDRATLPLPPCNVGLENPNEISCRLCLTTLQGEGSGKGWWCFNDFCQ